MQVESWSADDRSPKLTSPASMSARATSSARTTITRVPACRKRTDTRTVNLLTQAASLPTASQTTQPMVRIAKVDKGQARRHKRKGITTLPMMAARGGT